MTELGLIIKQLQRKLGISGQELASRIGITASSLSQIINGHAKPRQGTFSSLCKVLANDQADEKQLVDAFVRLSESKPEAAAIHSDTYAQAEIERAERFLEIKAQSIAFKRSVARELERASLAAQMDYCEGIYVTDFLVEHANRRFALECKFNLQRDLDKTTRIAEILKDKLRCHQSFIVTPYTDDSLSTTKLPRGISLVSLADLPQALTRI